MIPGASLFLYLLPLAAAPVLFHLLMRRQRKTVLFSTRMFFDSMKPRLSFHRKFREPLLFGGQNAAAFVSAARPGATVGSGNGERSGVRWPAGGCDCRR